MPANDPLSRVPADGGERIATDDPRFGFVSINPARMSGAPVFAGTRVPVQNLWDYLETGHTLNEFLADFEGVSRDAAIAVMELAKRRLLSDAA
jgi:uncharacterized protein (DUF433 family)